MGQSREAKKTNQMLDREYGNTSRQFDDFYNSRNRFADEARGRSNQAYNSAYQGYQDVFNDPSGGGGSRNRGVNPGRAGYDEFARTGGLSGENINRIRGNGVFDEFSRTGGLSNIDVANMRLYGSRTIPGFFDAVRRNLGSSSAAQGGYNPGYNSQTALLARDQARAAQDAALNTELGIVNTRNEGRRWGTEGMSGAERALVDANQRGRMFGIEGLNRGYEFDRESDRYDRNFEAQNRLAALEGMRGLRTDTPGEVGMYEEELLNSLMGGAGARRGLLQDRAAYNPNQNWFDKYGMPLLNAGAGVIGGLASRTGGGFFSGGRNRGNTGVTGGRYQPNVGMGFAGVPYFG